MSKSAPDVTRLLVERLCPLETDLLGPELVGHVIAGKPISRAEGGRYVDFMAAIQVVGCAAAVLQCVLTVYPVQIVRNPSTTAGAGVTPQDRQAISTLVEQRAAQDPALAQRLAGDPDLVARTIAAVADYSREQPPTS